MEQLAANLQRPGKTTLRDLFLYNMPVKKRKRPKRRLKKEKKINYFAVFVVFIFVLLFLGFKNVLSYRFWDGTNKVDVTIKMTSGDVIQAIFDPEANEITSIIIPGDTQLEVARNLGKWKLKSVWNLGKNEGLGGELLTRTISKSLKFPVYIWADSPAVGFTSPKLTSVLHAVFTPYKTNLSFGDKIALGFFSLKVKNVDRVEINLNETTFIKQKQLEDGTNGYILTGLPSPKLYSNFIDEEFTRGTLRVVIKDASNDYTSAKSVGELIEIMGGKISAITKEEESDVVCLVGSKSPDLAGKVAMIFGCDQKTGDNLENFDLEITLGKNFAQSF